MTHPWKQHLIAAGLAVLVTLCAGLLLRGKLAATPTAVPAMKPPSLGVSTADEQQPPNVLARADTSHKKSDNQSPPPKPNEITTPHVPNFDNAAAQQAPESTSVSSETPRTEATSPSPALSPPATKEPVLAAAPTAPTAVESRPRPIEEMSVLDIQKAVSEYERWVHNGRIVLRLDYSRLAPQQLNAIASLYYVGTQHTTLRVEPHGAAQLVTSDEVPAKALVGDLTGDRAKWPPDLAEIARRRFGPNHRAHANFVVTPACELTLYRVLAQAVGHRQPPPGTEFVLRLEPKGALIDVELLSRAHRGRND